MDLSGYSFMDLDHDSLSVGDANGSAMEYDHVKWQGSQTANHALNQLIRSSVNDPVLAKAKENVDVKGSCSRGWQREPSFDQIPGFSLLSTKDSSGDLASSSTSSSAFPATGTSGKSQSSSSRITIARPRPSEVKSSRPSSALAGPSNAPVPPASSLSSTLTIPFFDKTNPSQFLDILKGVSARVDANAGVRPRNSIGGLETQPSRIVKGKKRPRGVSMGGTSDLLVARLKKGRIEPLRESGGATSKAKDKGKGRMRSEMEDSGAVSVDNGSAQDNVGGSVGISSLRDREEANAMEVDDWSTTDAPDHPRASNSSSTSSQKMMPPPPAPLPVVKREDAIPSRAPPFSSSSTSSSSAPAIPRPPSLSHSSRVQSDVTSKDIKFPTTSQTPKYHPLLLQPPTKKPVPSACSSSHARQLNPQPKHPPTHVVASAAQPNSKQNIHPKIKLEPQEDPPVPPSAPAQRSLTVAPPSSSPTSVPLPTSTPQIPSSQSSRPPALGMRRTHTLPTMQKNGALPTKQKGFKPPLLSSSQPQPPSRSQLSNVSPRAPVATTATITRTNERTGGGKTHIPSSTQSYNHAVSEAPPSSNGSMSSASDYSRRGAIGPPSSSLSRSTTDSPASSFTKFPVSSSKSRVHPIQASGGGTGNANANNNLPKRDATRVDVDSPIHSALRNHSHATKAQSPPLPDVVALKPLPASPPLPEPADGDADSSFGDMSFDLDALEETMKQYD